jgi:hypothetical protein
MRLSKDQRNSLKWVVWNGLMAIVCAGRMIKNAPSNDLKDEMEQHLGRAIDHAERLHDQRPEVS